jgi:lipopolysaccharide export LptBFGC system permease protein LptF
MVIGVAVGFAFYLFNNIVVAYSLSGRLDAIVASWLPITVAGLVGITLLLQFGEE